MSQLREYPQPLVELYDSRYEQGLPAFGDDRELYRKLAVEFSQPVLELGVGTGRVACYLADRGIRVTGLDVSLRMLERARANITKLPEEAQQRITLVQGDMREFELERQFPLVIIPFSAFQHLLTVEEQMRSLQSIRRHLTDNGHLVIDLFDPKLDRCTPRVGQTQPSKETTHPETGCRWKIFFDSRENIPEEQQLREEWRFVELDDGGRVLNQFSWCLTLRWNYRFEMQHLFERSGLTVVNLWGDYQQGPFTYGQRQVWLVQKS